MGRSRCVRRAKRRACFCQRRVATHADLMNVEKNVIIPRRLAREIGKSIENFFSLRFRGFRRFDDCLSDRRSPRPRERDEHSQHERFRIPVDQSARRVLAKKYSSPVKKRFITPIASLFTIPTHARSTRRAAPNAIAAAHHQANPSAAAHRWRLATTASSTARTGGRSPRLCVPASPAR